MDEEKHRKRAREYYYKNKDKINEKRKILRQRPEYKAKMREYMRKYLKKQKHK